jgi:hypothetical protein
MLPSQLTTAIANQARARIATNVAVDDHRPSHVPAFGYAKHFAHISLAEDLLFLDASSIPIIAARISSSTL